MLLNWVRALQPLTGAAGWHWTADGKFVMNTPAQPSQTPWLHAPAFIEGIEETGADCGLFHIYHNNIFERKSIHSFCMECYKVVLVPENLEEVTKVAEWQYYSGWPCKVGAEIRPYVKDRKWGAYFYCRGLEQGRERYKEVRKWADENLSKDTRVFLKRACTEFEQHMGDSDKWEMIPRQDEIEEEGRNIFDYAKLPPRQADPIAHHVWDFWDDWVKETPNPVTYHEEG